MSHRKQGVFSALALVACVAWQAPPVQAHEPLPQLQADEVPSAWLQPVAPLQIALRTLPCDLLLTPHPGASGWRLGTTPGRDEVVSCSRYAGTAEAALDAALDKARAQAASEPTS